MAGKYETTIHEEYHRGEPQRFNPGRLADAEIADIKAKCEALAGAVERYEPVLSGSWYVCPFCGEVDPGHPSDCPVQIAREVKG